MKLKVYAHNNTLKSYDSENILLSLMSARPVPIFYVYIYIVHSNIIFWESYKEYFYQVSKMLNVGLPKDFEFYNETLLRLIHRNNFYKGTLVKVVFFPIDGVFNFFAFATKVEYVKFISDSSNVVLDSSRFRYVKPLHSASFVRQWDVFNYLYAYSPEETIIFSPSKKVVETPSMNIMMKIGHRIYSPTYRYGAYFNALQLEIIKKLQKEGYEIIEEPFNYELFKEADEVWCVKDCYGVYFRVGVDQYRYQYGSEITKALEKINSKIY